MDGPTDGHSSGGCQQGVENGDAEGQPTVLSKLQKWGDYEAVGQPVAPTRFLPMKTPMASEILANWSLPDPPAHSHSLPALLESQQAAGREVGMVLDLANHECLYADDLPKWLEYRHVQLVAKTTPAQEQIDEVERVARAYWARHSDKYIAIHCAYGFNRTGFVVCSYLCQACGLSVPEALQSFAAARPPGIKHDKFVHELYRRYGRPSAAQFLVPGASDGTNGQATGAASAQDSGAGSGDNVGLASAAAGPLLGLAAGSKAGGAGEEEEEEMQHFEDAAASVRQGQERRRGSSALNSPARSNSITSASSQQGIGDGGLPPGSRPGSAADGNPSQPGLLQLRRSSSRGSGGLSQALAARALSSASLEPSSAGRNAWLGGHSSRAATTTAASSISDFATVAAHLEGAHSLRRVTSLGLAKALCDDFTVHTGSTPPPDGVLMTALAHEQQAAAVQELQSRLGGLLVDGASLDAAASGIPRPLQQHQQAPPSPHAFAASPAAGSPSSSSSPPACNPAGAGVPGSRENESSSGRQPPASSSGATSMPVPVGGPPSGGHHHRRQSSLGGSPLKHGRTPGPLSSSPQRGHALEAVPPRQPGAISSSPTRQPHNRSGSYQQLLLAAHLSNSGGSGPYSTPNTALPSSSCSLQQQQGASGQTGVSGGGCCTSPSCTLPSMESRLSVEGSMARVSTSSRFPRSGSMDSENQSLGFGAREALLHLRGMMPAEGLPPRGAQALADLFAHVDSRQEMETLDEADWAEELSPEAPFTGEQEAAEPAAAAAAEPGSTPQHQQRSGRPHGRDCCIS